MDTHEPAHRQPGPANPVNGPALPKPISAESVTGLDEPVTSAGFLMRNAVTLVMVLLFGALLAYFLLRVEDSVDKLLAGVKVAIGLGVVIFIHELGHFVAAKLCDVHVETFSIGFGPPFLGLCSFKWGETTYKLAWFPLGGYVKMLGESEGEEGAEEDPRSFKNKSVGQRMIIISAGVVMNVVLAVVCFIFVYTTHGVLQRRGVIGHVEPGGAAWKKGITPGAYIRQINGKADPYYEDLTRKVVSNRRGQPMNLVYDTYANGQSARHEVQIVPAKTKDYKVPLLGIQSGQIPVLASPYKHERSPYIMGTVAARAEPAFADKDRVVGASDPADPDKVTPLPPDPRQPENNQLDYFDLRRRMEQLAGKPMTFRVEREGSPAPIDIRVPPAFAQTLGVRLRMGQVVALREGSPAEQVVRSKDGNQDGDVIAAVKVTRADGKLLTYSATPRDGEEPLDPIRLPMQLAQWAMSKPTDWHVRVTVLRPEGHKGQAQTMLDLTWDRNWDPLDEPPVYPNSPLSLSGLGLAYRVQAVIDGVDKGSPADGTPLKAGDVIKAIELKRTTIKGKTETTSGEVKDETAAFTFDALREPNVKEVTLTLDTDEKVTLAPREDATWPLVNWGLVFEGDTRVQKTSNVGEALVLGCRRLVQQMADIYEFLFDLVTLEKSADTISGPITIAAISYNLANRDFYELIMFIALININLAVVNFLPIPVLDGGHMVFLIYEKLRGKPPSDQVRFIATICGLVIVLGLMVFAFSVDIRQWFF